jgi:hypothetical protein
MSGTRLYVILEPMLIQTLAALWVAGALAAPPQAATQPYHAAKARKRFISLTFEKQSVQPSAFEEHPLQELLGGRRVDDVHLQPYQYQTRDQLTTVTVLEYRKPAFGVGATIYPFGSSEGATLAIRGSIESMPTIHLAFDGEAPAPTYDLTGGRALDVGVGLDMSDRSPGWGVGSHAFVIGGVGRAQTDQRDGTRYFGEGGGGIMFGPFGFDISVKYVVTRFDMPAAHELRTIPICVRGTLTF